MMEIVLQSEGTVVRLGLSGVMKKEEARRVCDRIDALAETGLTELVVDCGELAAVALDSVGYLISSLDRIRHKRVKVVVSGANPVVKKTFLAGGMNRVAAIL